MKKRWIVALIASLFCLTGCQNGGGGSSSDGPSELVKISAPYAAEDMETLLFTDVAKDLTIDVSANSHLRSLLLSVEYYEAPELSQENGLTDAKYILTLQDLELQVGVNSLVCFVAEETTAAVVLNEEFAYLDTIIDGDSTSFNGYTATQSIQVFNAENKEGAISDKTGFLQSFSALRFVKLNNKAHYTIGDKGYVIKIDNDEISVCQKFVTVGEDLYLLCQGDFEFLKGITFDSSSTSSGGWLPWI